MSKALDHMWLLVELVKVSLFFTELALADNSTRKRLHPLQQTRRLMWTRWDDGGLFCVRESSWFGSLGVPV